MPFELSPSTSIPFQKSVAICQNLNYFIVSSTLRRTDERYWERLLVWLKSHGRNYERIRNHVLSMSINEMCEPAFCREDRFCFLLRKLIGINQPFDISKFHDPAIGVQTRGINRQYNSRVNASPSHWIRVDRNLRELVDDLLGTDFGSTESVMNR